MTVEERRRRRFSEEFRKEQARLIESGKVTQSEVCRMYHVKWESVSRWLKRFGKGDRPGKIFVTDGKELDRIRELEREKKKLLEVIGRQQVTLVYQSETHQAGQGEARGGHRKKMMVPLLHAIKASRLDHGLPMEKFYSHVGISRQGFFKMAHRKQKERQRMQQIDALVGKYRKNVDRRAGSRSLYYNLDIKLRLDIGVSKFERIMSEGGLSLAPVRTRVVTTRSSLQSWNYSNLINGLTLNHINQVVAGDLTYVYIYGRRYLLFCLTDLYSARIVGHHIGLYMRAEDAKKALDMWVSLRKEENLKGCIHHTDGGTQYFSALYLT
jgi:transposase-like protein